MTDHPKGTGLLSKAEWHTILTPMPVPCFDATVTKSVRFMITGMTDPLPQYGIPPNSSYDLNLATTRSLQIQVGRLRSPSYGQFFFLLRALWI
jgi:hypothetical protein